MPQSIDDVLGLSPVIPVLVIEDIADAEPLARAIFDGGLRVLEVTLRSPVALDAAIAMKRAVPDAVIGVGTVMTPDALETVIEAGLDFGVSPGVSTALLDALRGTDFPFLPGAATVSEIMHLQECGFDALKFFPAEVSGGAGFLKSIRPVLPGVSFCPTGGIGPDNAQGYLALDSVRAVGGSWIAPPDLVRAGNWSEITARAAAAAGMAS